MAATRSRISVEEYLALPHVEPPWLEYFRGEVIEKPLPNADHSLVAGQIAEAFVIYRSTHGGRVGIESRTRFDDPLEPPSFLLPDVSFYAPGARMRDGQMMLPPTLAVEVVSPGQSQRFLDERATYLHEYGIPEVWIVDPIRRTVRIYEEADSVLLTGDDTARSTRVPGFEVALPWLFSVVDDETA